MKGKLIMLDKKLIEQLTKEATEKGLNFTSYVRLILTGRRK